MEYWSYANAAQLGKDLTLKRHQINQIDREIEQINKTLPIDLAARSRLERRKEVLRREVHRLHMFLCVDRIIKQ